MTDQLEAALREEFETVATGAAGAGAGAGRAGVWAGTARARVRARRRRTALATGAGVAVLAVAVPFAVLGRERHDRAAVPAADPSPSAPAPATPHPTSKDDPVADGILHLRGITVAVPKVMLEPGNRRCGSSLVDAAWWEDRHTAHEDCLIDIPTSGLNEVALRVAAPDEPVEATPRRTVLEDGRTAVSVGFPDRHVVLRVLSPLATRAERTVASARQLPEDSHVLGCVVRDPGGFELAGQTDGRTDGRVAPDPASAGVVCGYRDGWLVDAHPLGAVAASALAELVNAAPPMTSSGLRDCAPSTRSSNGVWTIGLTAPDGPEPWLRVDPERCPDPSIVSDQGFAAYTTPDLVAALAGHAQGPLYPWGDRSSQGSQVP